MQPVNYTFRISPEEAFHKYRIESPEPIQIETVSAIPEKQRVLRVRAVMERFYSLMRAKREMDSFFDVERLESEVEKYETALLRLQSCQHFFNLEKEAHSIVDIKIGR